MSYTPLRNPRYQDLSIRQLRHRIACWGESSTSPIVLLHGFMDNGATWQFLVDSLPADFSVAALDWRGFGHSAWAPGGYWFPDYLADLDALLESLSPRTPARIIGHSMGANIAQMYAGIRPDRVAWLINLEGLGLADSKAEDAPVRYEQWLREINRPVHDRRYRSVSERAALLSARNTRLPADRAEFVARAWTRPVNPSEVDGEVELLFDPRHRIVNPILYRRTEVQACWERITSPVLLITGEESPQVRRSGATVELMEPHIGKLRRVSVRGVGHMMHHENPSIIAAEIVKFHAEHLGQTV